MVAIMGFQVREESFRAMGMWTITLLLLWGQVRYSEAGCQRFGHSCFGAHGKRAEGVGEVGGSLNSGPTMEDNLQAYYAAAANNRGVPYGLNWLYGPRRSLQDPALYRYPPQEDSAAAAAAGERRRK